MSKKKIGLSKQRKRVHKVLWDKREDPKRPAADNAENHEGIPWDAIHQELDSKHAEPKDGDHSRT
jgi:hypothetical protein